jgi:hypothetical protein
MHTRENAKPPSLRGPAKSLCDADIVSAPAARGSVSGASAADASAVERRTALRVGAAGVASVVAFTLGTRPAHAVTDADAGPSADPPGRGRGNAAPGITDADQGPNSDPPRHGRGAAGGGRVPNRGEQPTGYSDRDPNDPGGYGATPPGRESFTGGRRREYTGLNDNDPADPAGYGTQLTGRPPGSSRRCTDTDTGPGDPQFGGRYCR